MMISEIGLAYVVPTKDRPNDLRRLLGSLQAQTIKPRQIIIVDGSSPDINLVCNSFPDLPITYIRCFPPSLAKQRNAGMAALAEDITVAGYLDDDIVLEPNATERMSAFWGQAPSDVGGASFSIINQGHVYRDRLLRFFLMHGSPPGRVLNSGFASFIPFIESIIETEWLYGGATLWRRSVIDAYSYDEWYIGHGFLEDLDYSYRVSRQYRLFVVGEAQCWHFSHPIPPSKQYELGRQQVFNRLYFVRKLGGFSPLAIIWALSGLLLMSAFAALRRPTSASGRRFGGNVAGLMAALRGRRDSFAGHWK